MQILRAPRLIAAAVLMAVAFTPAIAANNRFVVNNIEVNGLQRISTGTVFTYLPISVGDTVDATRIQAAIKSLYQTGFFADVQFRRAGDTLIIDVKERPSIANISFVGNEKIETEDLQKSLKQAGLAKGRIFSRSVLNDVKQQLMTLYHSHAKYSAKVDIKVRDLGNNRVSITINISEGVDTTIKSINIVGNNIFDDDKLLDQFELEPAKWFSLFQSNDRYVREKLSGDLESLRSFYMDRGYADFRINSVQVTISPDYKHIFVTINIHEGVVYTIHDTRLAGRLIVPKKTLRKLILAKKGTDFSMARANFSGKLITNLLGNRGYAFAEVNPVPKLDRDKHQVDVIFYVNPGNRVYVRHINFAGMPDTDNIVFRREMRQMEGAWLSNSSLKRSKVRLQRLRFVKKVDESTDPVPGSPDLVDLNYKLTARKAGSFNAGIGYSPYYGVSVNAGIQHHNFLGEGNDIALQLNRSNIGSVYDITWTDPFATVDGVRRTVRAYYRKRSALLRNSSPLDTKSYGLMLSYGIPLAEYQWFTLGGSASHNELLTNIFSSSQQYIDFASNPANGNTYMTPLGPAVNYRQYDVLTGWTYDSRNRRLFATRGNRQHVGLDIATPFSDVQYYTLTLTTTDFFSLGGGWLYTLNSSASWNHTYGGSPAVPPTKRFFVGGPRSVRGFRSGFLGPLDRRGYPAGGNFQFYTQNEIAIPSLVGAGDNGSASSRFGFFFDFGSVFKDASDFRSDGLYRSAGIFGTFITPLGVMHVSLGFPIGPVSPRLRETFQFTVGRRF